MNKKKFTRSFLSAKTHTRFFLFFFLHKKYDLSLTTQFLFHCVEASATEKKNTIFFSLLLNWLVISISAAMNSFIKRCFLFQNDVISFKMTIFSRVNTMIFPSLQLTIFFLSFFFRTTFLQLRRSSQAIFLKYRCDFTERKKKQKSVKKTKL